MPISKTADPPHDGEREHTSEQNADNVQRDLVAYDLRIQEWVSCGAVVVSARCLRIYIELTEETLGGMHNVC